MEKYRIVQGSSYDGCLPITVYWVQKRKEGFFFDKWENIKGFDSYSRAKQLLDLLKGR